MHVDPVFAKAFGFERPILHGLCTYGYVGRHVIKAFCPKEPSLFKSIKVRFADSVFPGETLITRMWKETVQRIVLEVRVKERDKLVIRNAAVELFDRPPMRKSKPVAQAISSGTARTEDAGTTRPGGPIAADVFAAIAGHLDANPGMGNQMKTVFQFQLRDPDSSWILDLKSGEGGVSKGVAASPDVTLELSEHD